MNQSSEWISIDLLTIHHRLNIFFCSDSLLNCERSFHWNCTESIVFSLRIRRIRPSRLIYWWKPPIMSPPIGRNSQQTHAHGFGCIHIGHSIRFLCVCVCVCVCVSVFRWPGSNSDVFRAHFIHFIHFFQSADHVTTFIQMIRFRDISFSTWIHYRLCINPSSSSPTSWAAIIWMFIQWIEIK